MKTMKLGPTDLIVPVLALGCMRIADMDDKAACSLVDAALEQGINFFDHADIYGGGRSEEVFARAAGMSPARREQFILQSKCGIRQGMYDFSKEHILASVDGILKRLSTDYLDVLLLHRPDALFEPQEVAEAFDALHTAGKVRYFGVSNQNPMQMELLAKYLGRPIVANQLQLSAAFSPIIDRGMYVNTAMEGAVDREGDVLNYCRLKNITIQAWSPFQHGFFGGVFIGDPAWAELNKALEEVGEAHGISPSAAAVAWILRHPAGIQTIVGTTKPQRVKELAKAAEVRLSREEWYAIYRAAGKQVI